MGELRFTGERMTTEYSSYGSIEHLHRYSLVQNLLKEWMTVLDVACGEGYGTNLISSRVRKAIGVDISNEAISHASLKYKSPNIDFIEAPATDIPLPDHSADLIVSFETLEHLSEQDQMLAEFKRILKPEGFAVISTPDKDNYSKGVPNPFHVKELTFVEFGDLMNRHFKKVRYFSQKMMHSSFIFDAENPSLPEFYQGSFSEIIHHPTVANPDFIIAVATDSESELPDLGSSFFDASGVFSTEYSDYIATREKYYAIVTSKRFRFFNKCLKMFRKGF
jgi:ubiquinone/menaquinone biosynthesis C-methylase UbiE